MKQSAILSAAAVPSAGCSLNNANTSVTDTGLRIKDFFFKSLCSFQADALFPEEQQGNTVQLRALVVRHHSSRYADTSPGHQRLLNTPSREGRGAAVKMWDTPISKVGNTYHKYSHKPLITAVRAARVRSSRFGTAVWIGS